VTTARRPWLPWARAGLAVAILVYLGVSGIIDWRLLRGMLRAWPYSVTALAALVAGFALVSWRACVLFAPRRLHLSFADSLRLTMVGNAANLVLPVIGSDMVRIVFTARGQAGRKTEIATIILLERVMGLVGILGLPLVLAPFFVEFIARHPIIRVLVLLSALGAGGLLVGMLIALSRRARQSAPVRFVLRRFPLGGYPARILDTIQGFRHAPRVLSAALALSVTANGLVALAIVLLHRAMHPGTWQPLAAFLASLGFVANNVPLTPGGIGVAEAAFDSLFSLAGLPGGAEAMIGCRVLFLALAPVGVWIYFRGVRPVLQVIADGAPVGGPAAAGAEPWPHRQPAPAPAHGASGIDPTSDR
jgi:glycosyltransferase 2 family protein